MEKIQEKECPSCGRKIDIKSKFCAFCGHKFENNKVDNELPLKPLSRKHKRPIVSFGNLIKDDVDDKAEGFANGLPSWSLEPPYIVNRRRGK